MLVFETLLSGWAAVVNSASLARLGLGCRFRCMWVLCYLWAFCDGWTRPRRRIYDHDWTCAGFWTVTFEAPALLQTVLSNTERRNRTPPDRSEIVFTDRYFELYFVSFILPCWIFNELWGLNKEDEGRKSWFMTWKQKSLSSCVVVCWWRVFTLCSPSTGASPSCLTSRGQHVVILRSFCWAHHVRLQLWAAFSFLAGYTDTSGGRKRWTKDDDQCSFNCSTSSLCRSWYETRFSCPVSCLGAVQSYRLSCVWRMCIYGNREVTAVMQTAHKRRF